MLAKKRILMILFIILVSGCQAQPAPLSPSLSPSLTKADLKPTWQEEWDKTIAAAKNEGKLVIYTVGGADVKTALSKAFREKFGVDIEYTSGRGVELSEKIFTERRAGLYWGDLYLGGTGAPLLEFKPAGILAPLKPLFLMPEVLDSKAYFDNEFPFIDKEGKFTIGHGMTVSNTLAVNSDSVKAGELKGYADLLDAKWKDKIVYGDPTIDGTAYNWFMVTAMFTMTPDYHRQLVKQNPLITRDMRQQVEWVARGKYSIALAPFKEIVAEFQKVGAPIKWVVPAEGVYVSGGATGSISYFDKAPHPNAARVFANWLLSKEGQTLWSRTTLLQTAREDIPTDFLPPESIRSPDVRYFNVNKEEVKLRSPEGMKLAREIYAALLK